MCVAYSPSRNQLFVASTERILGYMIYDSYLDGLIINKGDWIIQEVEEHIAWEVEYTEEGEIKSRYIGKYPAALNTKTRSYQTGGYSTSWNNSRSYYDRDRGVWVYEPSTACKGFDTNNLICKHCSYSDICDDEVQDSLQSYISKSSSEIITAHNCNGYYITAHEDCRTCVLRNLCKAKIPAAWDSTKFEDLKKIVDENLAA